MRKLTPAQAKAKELMERDFERIGNRWHQHVEEQLELRREREELEALWRLAGFGEPPRFRPTVPVPAELERVS